MSNPKFTTLVLLLAGCANAGNGAPVGADREPTTTAQARDCVREALATGLDYPSDPDQPYSAAYAVEAQVMALRACPGVEMTSMPASSLNEAASEAAELYRGGVDYAAATFAETADLPGTYAAVGFTFPKPTTKKCF